MRGWYRSLAAWTSPVIHEHFQPKTETYLYPSMRLYLTTLGVRVILPLRVLVFVS